VWIVAPSTATGAAEKPGKMWPLRPGVRGVRFYDDEGRPRRGERAVERAAQIGDAVDRLGVRAEAARDRGDVGPVQSLAG